MCQCPACTDMARRAAEAEREGRVEAARVIRGLIAKNHPERRKRFPGLDFSKPQSWRPS